MRLCQDDLLPYFSGLACPHRIGVCLERAPSRKVSGVFKPDGACNTGENLTEVRGGRLAGLCRFGSICNTFSNRDLVKEEHE